MMWTDYPCGDMTDIKQVAAWISVHAHRSEPFPLWVSLLIGALVTTATVGAAWRVTQYPCTLAHELGHAYVGRIVGRGITGIKMQPDTSGVTHSSGAGGGLGFMLMLAAGYSTPPVVGALCTWAALHGWSGAAALVLAFLLAIAIPLGRNLLALATIASSAAVFLCLAAFASAPLVTGMMQATGIYLGVTGVRSTFNLARAHRSGQGSGSDADQLRGATFIPGAVWVCVFVGCSITAAAWQVALIGQS